MAFKLDMDKLDKLTEDLKKLDLPKVVKGGKDGEGAVPMFQCKGYLEKMGTKKKQWYKRFFVLRDSFLLSYNLNKSDFTVEPNKCIHLVKCKIEMLEQGDKKFCFAITTQEKDRFLFSAESEKARGSWRKDIEIGRIISHKNMVKLAVENQCLAEEKGVVDLMKSHSSSALSIFSNQEYIKKTPLTGGAEGWLKTVGFCTQQGKKSPKKCYFMLKDSHILMFHGGDVLKKPRGCMYLVGTKAEEMESNSGDFKFGLTSKHCADFIELHANSEAQRKRWMAALRGGARVTYGDFKLLLKEHELLQNLKPGATSAPEPEIMLDNTEDEDGDKVNEDDKIHEADIVAAADTDIADDELEPGTAQPYDAEGNPLIRKPDGKLVDKDEKEVDAKTARYTATGKQMDAFNRPLPSGAKPMFTSGGQPIGVGPDGKHYLPDGTEISHSAPHFDSDGNQLNAETIAKADEVAGTIAVQIKTRQRMKPEGAAAEEVDALGRTFRGTATADGMLTNADGEQVPALTARRTVTEKGDLVTEAAPAVESKQGVLAIKVDEEGEDKSIGSVEINEHTTMKDVRAQVAPDLAKSFDSFVFLVNYIPISKAEEMDMMAMACLPEVYVRGVELKKVAAPKFSKKLAEMSRKADEAKSQQNEFEAMMAKVRGGNFLKKVNPLGED
jgi:hypothetical protein